MEKKMKKAIIVAVFAVSLAPVFAFACIGWECGPVETERDHSFVEGNANQWLNANGESSVNLGEGLTFQNSDLTQNEWGTAQNGSIEMEQNGAQVHEYQDLAGGENNFSGHYATSIMDSQMWGQAGPDGNFNANAYTHSDSIMQTENAGIGSMNSFMAEGVQLGANGSAYGSSSVGIDTELNTLNKFAQYRSNGEDFVYQEGESLSLGNIRANSNGCGTFAANINGGQSLNMSTLMDGEGKNMQGSMNASANMNLNKSKSGNTLLSASGIMNQKGAYEQYNQGDSGMQYQSGKIETTVYVGQ